MRRKQGFTVVEIVVAMVLLAIAGVLLAASVRTAGMIRLQAQSWQNADEALGQTLAEAAAKESAAYQSVKLTGGGKTLTAQGVTDSEIGAVWVNVPALEDSLFQHSGAVAQALPGLLAEPELTPPAAPAESGQKALLKDAAYFDGNGFAQPAPPADGGIYQGQTGALAAVGVTSVSQSAAASWLGGIALSQGSNLVLGEEVLVLAGDITATSLPEDGEAGSLWLLPQSGHGQPALVYVAKEDGVKITWNYTDTENNTGAQSVTLPKGWYAIGPTEDEQAAGIAGVDLIGLTKYGGADPALPAAWEQRLKEWSLEKTAMLAVAQKQHAGDPAKYPEAPEEMVQARLDAVWARLVLAGVYDGLYE